MDPLESEETAFVTLSYNPFGQHALWNDEEQERRCRQCQSTALHTDWAQGDRVCTNCGVVDEGHLLDDRPEWRDFHDADDLAKGLPSGARSGLVPVDETKYIGGLQPTTLSKHIVGGGGNQASSHVYCKRLVATNRKLDKLMERQHRQALQDAQLSRRIQCKQLQQNPETVESSILEDVRPEHELMLIREEEDQHRLQAALYAEKWSLERALLLHGNEAETASFQSSSYPQQREQQREELQSRLDATLRKAAADLFKAYRMLTSAAERLQLPDRVVHESTHMLCKYAGRRDGFFVKGVSSRLSARNSGGVDAKERLREYNQRRQMGSLCSVLLFVTARNLGWTRSLAEVCASIHPAGVSAEGTSSSTFIKARHFSRAMQELKTTFPDYARAVVTDTIVAAETTTSKTPPSLNETVVAVSNFTDHSLRKLRLPPVAEAAVRALVGHCRTEQIALGKNSGTKLSTLCASVAYFVCVVGATMQRLAKQATSSSTVAQVQKTVSNEQQPTRRRAHRIFHCGKMQAPPLKRMKLDARDTPRAMTRIVTKNTKAPDKCKVSSKLPPSTPTPVGSSIVCALKGSPMKDTPRKNGETKTKASNTVTTTDSTTQTSRSVGVTNCLEVANSTSTSSVESRHMLSEEESEEDNAARRSDEDVGFDVFSHPVSEESISEKKEYEMRRMWDTWADQMPWFRSLREVEQSCGVSKTVVLEYYKTTLYPERQALLKVLKDATASEETSGGVAKISTLHETPLAPILLAHVTTAAPLMNNKGKL